MWYLSVSVYIYVYIDVYVYRSKYLYTCIRTSHGKYKCMLLTMICEQHTGVRMGESLQVCMCHVGKQVHVLDSSL